MNITCNVQVVVQFFPRKLELPQDNSQTFFLWGPRQTGKSTLLIQHFPNRPRIDLLRPEAFRRYTQHPEILIEEVEFKRSPLMVIDEIQKVPALLDVVHWLIENRGVQFALCGSSARKVRRGHANLLGGRGILFEMFGLSAAEIGESLDFVRLLNNGYLPTIYQSSEPLPLLDSYVSQYLKEEVAAEGLARRLPTFSEFLSLSALSDADPVNYTTIARDTGVSSQTIKGYFEILQDTLLGRFLQPYRRRPKRRIVAAPKFYFHDVGVVNFLAKRGTIVPGSPLFGKAFENWVFHELVTYNSYRSRYADFFYWRLSSGTEVDFIVNHIDCAIEAKASSRIRSDHLKGLRELKSDHPETARRIVVSLEPADRRTEDDIEIVGYQTFLKRLWNGELF